MTASEQDASPIPRTGNVGAGRRFGLFYAVSPGFESQFPQIEMITLERIINLGDAFHGGVGKPCRDLLWYVL